MNDPNGVAKTIQNLIDQNVDKAGKTFKRGIVLNSNGRYIDVYIEGNTVPATNVLCLGSYDPYVGDKCLIISIGDSGINLLAVGSLNAAQPWPAFKLDRSSAVAVSSGTTKINYNRVVYNIGNGYVSGAQKFTAPYKGLYHFDAVTEFAGGPENVEVSIRVNATTTNMLQGAHWDTNGILAAQDGGTLAIAVSGDLILEKDQYAEVYTYADDGGTTTANRPAWNVFSGHLVRKLGNTL